MTSFYFKAYDDSGGKRAGTIDAYDARSAHEELQRTGLRPYVVVDYAKVKGAMRKKRRRRKIIAASGVSSIVATLLLSVMVVSIAGREREPTVEDLKKSGIIKGNSGLIVANSEEEREFADQLIELWGNYAPRVVTGVEVSVPMLTVYVSRRVDHIPFDDIEMLVSNTVKALQRQFDVGVATLNLVRGDDPILRARYNAQSRSARIKWLR